MNSEAIEIGADRAGVWVAFVECPVPDEFYAQESLKLRGRGCDDNGNLKTLAKSVQAAMQPLGFQPEQREFSAHLTLGRVKFPRPDAALTRALDSIKNQTFGAMRVEAIHLFQSQLHPQGSIYTKLSTHKLM